MWLSEKTACKLWCDTTTNNFKSECGELLRFVSYKMVNIWQYRAIYNFVLCTVASYLDNFSGLTCLSVIPTWLYEVYVLLDGFLVILYLPYHGVQFVLKPECEISHAYVILNFWLQIRQKTHFVHTF